VDNVAIASDGPVHSVFVAHDPGVTLTEVELDPASATAVALMRCLLRQRAHETVEFAPPMDNLSVLEPGRARLLIGDQAIRFRQKFGERYTYWDLGQAWRDLTDVPFVFALWLIRPEVKEAKRIADTLRIARDNNLAHFDELIAEQAEFAPAFCAYYYRDCLRFDFGEKEKAGLRLFRTLCLKYALLESTDDGLTIV
jgi:predicted solute-binding protein